MRQIITTSTLTAITFVLLAVNILAQESAKTMNGPLRVSDKNPRYFTDNSGKAIYLTGSHTWNNLVDMTTDISPEKFDYLKYLQWMVGLNHNFIRLWRWELLNWDTQGNWEKEPKTHTVAPHPLPGNTT